MNKLTISEQTNTLQHILGNHRFENVQLKSVVTENPKCLYQTHTSNWPLAPATLTAVWLPMTCAATIVIASHCVGFTFPGMMLLPGSFSGKLSSPRPQRGPDPRYRISFAIFISEHASTLRAPCASTRAS
jgi:hypothetical protein